MNPFFEMLQRTQSTSYFDRAYRFARPLKEHLGINHFWYYQITNSGLYSYMGSNREWNEYCFEHSLLNAFPCIRHPKVLRQGVSLMRASPLDAQYQQVRKIAWDQFQINFHLNIFETSSHGIEAFGFGSRFDDHRAEERLLNELPLLRYFIKTFRKNHQKLFQLLQENQVDLTSHMGRQFYENSNEVVLPFEREKFLTSLGLRSISDITQREKDLLKLLASGYPASYIKDQLHLGLRTVENYIAVLKSKLHCNSKVALIQKAQEIVSTGWLD